LGTVRSALLKVKPPETKIAIAAFTATANPEAQQTIIKVLQLQKPEAFLLSPYRSNLHLQVQTVWTPRGRKQQLLNFIKARPKQSGLVYVRTRKDSENLANLLEESGYQTAAYHAGLSAEERRQIETAWLNNQLKFVVCSSAFGMGINKSDVRWVVHFQAPLLLSEYIQEIGRGGRDGKSAIALTLISEPTGLLYPEDKQRKEFFQDKLRSQYREAQQLAKNLPVKGDVDTVSREFPESAIALSILHSSGQLKWQDPFNYVINKSAQQKAEKPNFTVAEEMVKYLKHKECRWQFLLQAFGFSNEAKSMRCGHCDNCR
jgi:ATP-dependent DNA helicase RecQ